MFVLIGASGCRTSRSSSPWPLFSNSEGSRQGFAEAEELVGGGAGVGYDEVAVDDNGRCGNRRPVGARGRDLVRGFEREPRGRGSRPIQHDFIGASLGNVQPRHTVAAMNVQGESAAIARINHV